MHFGLQGAAPNRIVQCSQTTTEEKNSLKTSQVSFLRPVKSSACFHCGQHASRRGAEPSARTVSRSRKIRGLIMSIKRRYECQRQKHLWLTDNCIFVSLQGAHHRNGLIGEAAVAPRATSELGARQRSSRGVVLWEITLTVR